MFLQKGYLIKQCFVQHILQIFKLYEYTFFLYGEVFPQQQKCFAFKVFLFLNVRFKYIRLF